MTREADVAGLVERQAVFVTALAEAGIPHDMLEVLLRGNPRYGIAPGALKKALAALSAEPVAGEVERVVEEEIAWERTQSAKRDIGKKAAACHSYAVFALEGARDKVRALSHAAPTGEG